MCGIVGIYLKTKKFEKNLGKMLSGMLNNMESRGPDSAGFAIYKKEGNKIYKFSLCINNLNFNIFKKELSKKIKKSKIKCDFRSCNPQNRGKTKKNFRNTKIKLS
jgi:glutamate synthase domain-containing protein 1